MSLIADLRSLETSQRSAIWASYLGWTLDAFDFFLMVFMFSAIAKEFRTDVKADAESRLSRAHFWTFVIHGEIWSKSSVTKTSQFTKTDHVLRGMGLSHLRKNDQAIRELADKGMTPDEQV